MKRNPVLIILGILLSLNLLAWIAVWELGRGNELEVTFFDVGQGDAIFIETPERFQILIDGGPTSIILEKLGSEMPFWDRTIDLVILTHPEYDHLAGLLEVLKRYKVENILWTGVVRDTAAFREWQKLIEEEGAQIHIARAGQQIEGGSALLNIFYPFENLAGQEFKNSNPTSIITGLVFGETSFLFTGDATKVVERFVLDRVEFKLDSVEYKIDSEVLKVGHHGSRTSTSKEFVDAVSPEIAVISAGRNNTYGHPHPEVLDNLAGILILRTDLNGDIKILTDGAKLSTFLKGGIDK